jgi:hypothetical protein
LHQGKKVLADVVVPIGDRPAAVSEPVVAILVRTARRLDDAVEGDELLEELVRFEADGKKRLRVVDPSRHGSTPG